MTTRLTAAGARGAQYPQRAFARGDDEFVLVVGHIGYKRRSDVQHVVAAIDRIAPAGILRQVGGENRTGTAMAPRLRRMPIADMSTATWSRASIPATLGRLGDFS